MLNQKLMGAAAGASAEDPNFKNVSLLLNGEPNQSLTYTAFSDASTNNFSITPNGDTYGTPFSPYNTSWSNYFDGTGDYLTVANNAAWDFGSGDFTIEFFVNVSQLKEQFFYARTDNSGYGISIQLNSSNRFIASFSQNGSSITTVSTTISPSVGSWNHVALTRSSGTMTLWINGASGGTAGVSGSLYNPAFSVYIGIAWPGLAYLPMVGYISNLRIVKGTAVYTGNFTPPSLANLATSGSASAACYSSTTNVDTSFAASATSLLTCQSNRFIDNSSNNFTIARNGDVAIKSFSPFTDTDTTTGSGYFDGNGDFLTAPNDTAFNFGTGDFTVECWCYFNSLGGSNYAPVFANGYLFYVGLSGQMLVFNGSTNVATGTNGSIAINGWYHLAWTRASGTVRMFVNGTQTGSNTTVTASIGSGSPNQIGRYSTVDLNGYISNLRVVKGTAVYTGNFTPPTASLATSGAASAASYPSTTNVNTTFASSDTSLLTLQTRGATQNIGFIDSSPNKFPITKVGNTTQGTFSPYGNLWSNYFDGTGDYLSIPASTNWRWDNSAFTAELWVCNQQNKGYTGRTNVPIQLLNGSATNDVGNWSLGTNAYGIPAFYYYGTNGATIITGTSTIPLNTWAHIAITYDGSSTIKLYVNGTLEATATKSGTPDSGSQTLIVGAGNASYYNGYISNLRIVKGRAVYTGNFTPSTVPLGVNSGGTNPPQGTETSLLTCQSNRFIDNSSNNFTITRNGDVKVTKFSPFNPTAAYSASTIGGSGYFDGTGDSLGLGTQAAFPTGTQNFTIEFWAYKTGAWAGVSKYIFSDIANAGLEIWTLSDGTLRLGRAAVAPVLNYNASGLPSNAWIHFAYSRKGNDFALWVNGTRVATVTDSNAFATTNGTQTIGAIGTSSSFDGYLSNMRIVKNAYVYDTASATITVPTAPLTAITNTSILCNFTNAGIQDLSMQNNLETVGNARVSTSVKKYGTGSLYFDGTGDYLSSYAGVVNALGTSSFTIEAWIYPAGTSVVRGVAGTGVAAGTWQLGVDNSNGQIKFWKSSNTLAITSSSNATMNTWSHLAVVRSGTTLTMYLNGTSVGSTTDSSDYTITTLAVGDLGVGVGQTWQGYIDDLRITKGYARYPTEPFPTAALPLY